MVHTFAYSSWPQLRPVLSVELRAHDKKFDCLAIVDSGADRCVFPLDFATSLGLDPRQARSSRTNGVGGGVDIFTWDIEMVLPLGIIRGEVGFTETLSAVGFGLLGQHGFFDRTRVTFDRSNSIFMVEVLYGEATILSDGTTAVELHARPASPFE